MPPRASAQSPESRRALTTLTLGLTQAIAANSWSNSIGVLLGALGFLFGAALHFSSSLSSPPRTKWPRKSAQLLSAFLLLLLCVRLASSPDPRVLSFPSSCPSGLQGKHGCSRVAVDNPHRAPPGRASKPFRARATLRDIEAEVLAWIAAQPRFAILRHDSPSSSGGEGERQGFVHARAVTPLWGFADDVFVRWRCTKTGDALVEVQGQLRLGVGDMGVNVKRNGAILRHLEEARIPTAAWCR